MTHIIVSGVTGVGKTTWARALAEHSGGTVAEEIVEDGALFRSANQDTTKPAPRALAQLYFLMVAAEQHAGFSSSTGLHFQDHSIYEVAEVYTPHLVAEGILSASDAKLVSRVYDRALEALPLPHAILFLRASYDEIRRRILERRRGTDVLPTNTELDALEIARIRLWRRLAVPIVDVDVDNTSAPTSASAAVSTVWDLLLPYVPSQDK